MTGRKIEVKKPEILAPAGNMECLETALLFGADAVYFAGKRFGLRAFADNFDIDGVKKAVDTAHGAGAKAYMTLNALMREDELNDAVEYAKEALDQGVDAFIVSDPGLIAPLIKMGAEVHLSTQASTMNSASVKFWADQGVSRVVLARELSLSDISKIHNKLGDAVELEAFVHGAMCIAYSGRCLLSSVMTGRSGNRGECAQPCRFEYQLYEKGFPEDLFPIMEDARGTYVMNSKDLMMIEHIPELIDAGIVSFKIEGRMKGMHYVASVVHAYRMAVDAYLKDPENWSADKELIEELGLSATRRFTKGFFFGNPHEEGQDVNKDYTRRRLTFCGIVRGKKDDSGMITVEQRGKFSIGETLSVLSPLGGRKSFVVKDIYAADTMEAQPSAPHPQQMVKLSCDLDLNEGDILRRLD